MASKLQEAAEKAAIEKIGYSIDKFDGEDWEKVEWFKHGFEHSKEVIEELVKALRKADNFISAHCPSMQAKENVTIIIKEALEKTK